MKRLADSIGPTIYRWAGIFALLLPLWSVSVAHAQPVPADAKLQAQLRTVLTALQQNHLTQAQREIELIYQRESTPAVLEVMGQIAEQSGDAVAAADIYRRMLDDQPGLVETHKTQLALIEREQDRAAEVAVSGAPGALLRVDGRLVGRVPLARALLLAPGKHRLTHETNGQSASYSVEVSAGFPIGLRFVADSAHVAVETRPPVLLITYNGQARPVPGDLGLARAVCAGLREDGQAHDLAAERLRTIAIQRTGNCLNTDSCLSALARKLGAQGVLVVTSKPTVQLGYIDARLEARTDQISVECPGCNAEQQMKRVQSLTQDLVARMISRAYGTLDLHVQPPGAEIFIGESNVAAHPSAPFSVQAGTATLLLRKKGYLPLRVRAELPIDAVTRLDLSLRPNAVAKRRQKVAAGKWVLFSAGVLGIAGGVVGLALDGRFTRMLDSPGPNGELEERFTSLAQGSVILGLGIAAMGGGVGLALYERKLSSQARADEAAALQLTLSIP